jgi:hypothetical protein
VNQQHNNEVYGDEKKKAKVTVNIRLEENPGEFRVEMQNSISVPLSITCLFFFNNR